MKLLNELISVRRVNEGGMPSDVIKAKQRLANMSPKEFYDRKEAAFAERNITGDAEKEDKLRRLAWSHGYGKMSSHYWNKWLKGKVAGQDSEDNEEDGQSASDKGYKAAERGQGRDANPYRRGTEDYMDWNEAWDNGSNQFEPWNLQDDDVYREIDDDEDEEESNPTDLGYAAAIQGEGRETNPFPQGTEDYIDWNEAWDNADHEDASMHDDDGQPSEHQEWQDYMGGDDWDHGQYDDGSYEDEGETERGLGAYGQRGSHMSGVKKDDSDEFERNPEAADELDLGDELGDNGDESENTGDETDSKLNALADKSAEDPDRQGLIRKVKSAHLVYKRQTEQGTYEELWIYNAGNIRDELEIRKAILSGTDIPTTKKTSKDGSQEYELWTVGNAEMLQIQGLPN
jgi:ribosome modulation factor